MTIKEFLKHLMPLAERYPEAEVVLAADGEGNDFHRFAAGGPGVYIEWNSHTHLRQFSEADYDDKSINAICLWPEG